MMHHFIYSSCLPSCFTVSKSRKAMKTLLLAFAIFFSSISLSAQQQAGKDPKIPVVERTGTSEKPAQNASAVRPEPRNQRGLGISSAARRSSLAAPGTQSGLEAPENANNASHGEKGKTVANQMRQNRIERPNAGNRPNMRVPAARPSVPVVRPNRPLPNRPIRPVRPPGARI